MNSSQLKPERNMELHKNKWANPNHQCIIPTYPQITHTLNAITAIFILPEEKWSSYGNTGQDELLEQVSVAETYNIMIRMIKSGCLSFRNTKSHMLHLQHKLN